MEKDIYEILSDKLNEAGYGFAVDCNCEKEHDMIEAARYALYPRNLKPKNYAYLVRTAAARLKLTPDRMEPLLYIARCEKSDVSVIELEHMFGPEHTNIILNVCSLQVEGYLDEEGGSSAKRVKVSVRGLMCLISGQPINNLNMSPFIQLTASGLSLPNTSVKRKAVKVTEPFLQTLGHCVDSFRRRASTMNDLVERIETALGKPGNREYRETFSSFGYYSLPKEQKAFILVLCRHFMKNGTTGLSFKDTDLNDLRGAAVALVTAGLVIMPPDDSAVANKEDEQKERYLLSADIVGAVFRGKTQYINYATVCKQADVRKNDRIEDKDLLFDDEMSKQVSCLKVLVDPVKSADLMDKLKGIGRRALTCLFYGSPGTGKTELCLQLARQTGRDCIIADPAKLNGAFWGDSEKNIREIFRTYRYLYKICDRAPILVFNEADGLISKRFTRVERSIDKCENTVQGIILQELESFEGIFIATTNLPDCLDVAYDRRFLFKMRFDNPSARIRSRLIQTKVSGISKEDADTLAGEYDLSGGQIDNIASKCIIEQFVSGEEVSLEKMRSICSQELSLREKPRAEAKKIGFIRY